MNEGKDEPISKLSLPKYNHNKLSRHTKYIQGAAEVGLQLFSLKITQYLVKDNTRINSAFCILITVNLLLPHTLLLNAFHQPRLTIVFLPYICLLKALVTRLFARDLSGGPSHAPRILGEKERIGYKPAAKLFLLWKVTMFSL